MTLGKKLREIRLRKKMSLQDVATLGGFMRPVLWKIEQGKSAPRPETMKQILRGLGILPDSREWEELHALWGAARTGNSVKVETLAENMAVVQVKNGREAKAFLAKLTALSDDDFDAIRKAVARPAVLSAIHVLHAVFERKG